MPSMGELKLKTEGGLYHPDAEGKPVIYIAGPMTGIKDYNFPAFFDTAEGFEEGGWFVFNPAAHDLDIHGDMQGVIDAFAQDKDQALRDCLGWDLRVITRYCDAIAMLPGWQRSFGAMAEHATAVALGLQIIYLDV